ncbi:cytochrome P450 [Actinorhabdospora filicis]|uniref:Cytochrome P450 n=1 Tax=Actinorhabdospora filicis TaxID=1785913 RepID=A0A9W6STE3_9ACTN|nr:cytochrome P450 [Actinorhabdospora filicis]GLZ81497.1 cytochrome P450 [Actinorhabdospora filicis]
MSETIPTVAGMPAERAPGCPFSPPPELSRLAEESPIVRSVFTDGHEGYLVTGYALAREVLADNRRFSSRQELMHHPTIDFREQFGDEIPPGLAGDLTALDEPEHGRLRRMLTGRFTVRRMRMLTERIEEVTAVHLDLMAEQGPPVDLVTAFAQPIPTMLICELLGVPYDERDMFRGHVENVFGGDASMEERMASFSALGEYNAALVAAKRANPTDDLLSDLTDSEMTPEEHGGIATLLLAAGLDTTASMLALGVLALLERPEQAAIMRDDPEAVPGAVEELMRYLSIASPIPRVTLEEVELGGQVIPAGTTLMVAVNVANRDDARFADPGALDLRRHAAGHLAFGHGVHQCLGQQLARVEMRVAFPALLRRFPDLRLAGEAVTRASDASIHGLTSMPVAWGE